MKIKIMILLFFSLIVLSCGREEESVLISGKEQTREAQISAKPEQESPKEQKVSKEKEVPEEKAEAKVEKLEKICVYICGAVAHPGVYFLEEGTRLFQGIEAAGGFLQEADQDWWNQAALLEDGAMIRIYTKEETKVLSAEGKQSSQMETGSLSGEETASQNTGTVNVNTASKEELETIPGIGEARADAIIRYREENGAFESAEDFQQIPGIKGKIFEKIKEYISW